MPRDSLVLAIDVGGTHIRLAAVGASGHIQGRLKRLAALSGLSATADDAVGERVLGILADAMWQIRKRYSVQAVGVGFPGFFYGNTGVLASSPNIPALHEFPLAAKLSEAMSLPVLVQNDATVAALGESRFGAGRDCENLLHLTLGTGVGGGLILNGSPYTGEGGMAMEIGHLRVVSKGRSCGCGGMGCLEAYASATAIATRYSEISGRPVKDAEHVYQRAKKGDHTARQMFGEAAGHLGYAIAEAVKLLDVHHISISGGLTGAWDLLSDPMAETMNAYLIPPLKGLIDIRRSRLGDNAGLLGAAALAMENPAG